jgi:hypothetical protein
VPGPSAFELVAICVDRYDHHPRLPLAGRAQALARRLRELGATGAPLVAGDHRRGALHEFLRDWSTTPGATAGTLVYWAGHGESTGAKHWLLSSDSANPASDVDGIQTAELATYVREEYRRRQRASSGDGEDPWTVVVLDCCGAGLGVRRLAASLYDDVDPLPRVWALLGTHGDQQAYADRFAGVLDDAIDSFAETDPDIRLDRLLGELKERLGNDAELDTRNLTQSARIANPRYLGAGVTMSLDVRDELRRLFSELDEALRTHFVPKAQGAELGELAWYFTGRRAQTRRIVGWLRDAPDGMLVVTGAAGSGKSALLGHIVAMSDSRLVEALQRAGQLGEIAADQRAPDATFDAVVHLSALRKRQ